MYEASMGTHMYIRSMAHAQTLHCSFVIFFWLIKRPLLAPPHTRMGNENSGGGGSMAAVQNQLFNIKFTAKQIHRMSKKCEKEHTQELTKVKKAMEKGDAGSARIYAENAIRIKNTGTGYLRMASRLEAVASRLESAIQMQQISKQMGNVVKGMDVRRVCPLRAWPAAELSLPCTLARHRRSWRAWT